ncbi:hypothetical protein OIU84_020848 [Salix udensis]|uniref:Uncharacterized protein n=1 Tax=Salix udensis TaxID=889485 RepID=A0AAD6PHG9_9ROSI|nr:hypothetical protein OIU84_020848 [Salix udensis]
MDLTVLQSSKVLRTIRRLVKYRMMCWSRWVGREIDCLVDGCAWRWAHVRRTEVEIRTRWKRVGVLGETGPGSSVTRVWISLKEEQENRGDEGCDLEEEGNLEGDLNQLGHMNEREEKGRYLGVEKASGEGFVWGCWEDDNEDRIVCN